MRARMRWRSVTTCHCRFGYFLAASGVVVAMTFVILGVFWRHNKPIDARDDTILRGTVPGLLVAGLQLLAVLALTLLVATGLFGNPATFKNITPPSPSG